MTKLEIVLTAIIWIAYGCFNFNEEIKAKATSKINDDAIVGGFFFHVLFAPVILAIRLIWGTFTSKFFDKW